MYPFRSFSSFQVVMEVWTYGARQQADQLEPKGLEQCSFNYFLVGKFDYL
ncbi:hypothetical protein RchiOBHm_Chr4g0437151 [Rosa chinensis]|uniref:Uncharacterized protein n=1 Tax=Rosa chinensis TaxID=74649 RepID=A0A2P6R277_ROSCH|nr:hypothetical protein RchiOBHm_Chr4g0437151 [Rosa chinensis]